MATTFDEDRKARARAMSLGGAPGATAPEMFNKTAPGAMTGVAPKPAAAELAAPSTPSAPSVQGAGLGALMPDTQAVYKESGKAISDLTNQGRYGAAAGETARAALAYVPAVANDVLGKPVAALAGGAWDGAKQFLGMNDGVQPKTATSVTPPANPSGPRAANVAQTKNPAANQGVAPVTAAPTSTAVQPTVATPAGNGYTDLGNGVYRKGNSFTDNPNDTKFAARGAMTPQNQTALDNLAASRPGVYSGGYSTDAFQQLANLQKLNAQPVQPTAVQPSNPQASGFNRDDSIRALTDITSPEYRALRSLKMDAESEAADRSRMGRGYKGAGAGDAYNALIKEITTGTREGQTAEMKDATDRYGIDRREDGATQRTAMGEQGSNARALLTAGLQGEELGLKREAQGYQTRAASRMEELQKQYLGAKTPEEQQTILLKYNALAGNGGQKADVWGYAPGKQVVDGNGNVVDGSGVLFNKQTGETREVAKSGGSQALPPGMTRQVGTQNGVPVYEDAKGNRFIGG